MSRPNFDTNHIPAQSKGHTQEPAPIDTDLLPKEAEELNKAIAVELTKKQPTKKQGLAALAANAIQEAEGHIKP